MNCSKPPPPQVIPILLFTAITELEENVLESKRTGFLSFLSNKNCPPSPRALYEGRCLIF